MIYVDGFDLRTIGVITSDIPELRSGLPKQWPTVPLPERPGETHTSREGQTLARRLTMLGWYNVADHAAVLAGMDDLKYRVEDRVVDLRMPDKTDRRWWAVLEDASMPSTPPVFVQRVVSIKWVWLLADPLAYDVTPTVVDFTAAAQTLSLGNAKHYAWTIEVTGPISNPQIILTNAGVEVARLAFTVDVAGGSTLALDSASQKITIDGADAYEYLDEGSRWPKFDPRGGANAISITPLPTFAELTYHRAWRGVP